MTKTLDCPNCGAPLDNIQPGSLTYKCPFCHSSVLLPPELNNAVSLTSVNSDVESILGHAQDLQRMTDLARSGKQIEAIKIFREVFDTSLAESKRAIEAIAAGQPFVLPGQMKVIPATPSQTELLMKIARLNNDASPLEAIKLFKETYGTSLRDSKDMVEKLAAGGPVTLPDGTTFQVTQGFLDMTSNPALEASMPASVKSKSVVSILALTGMAIGLIAVLTVIIFGITSKNNTNALIAPFSTETPYPTPTEVPFASPIFTIGGEGTGPGLFSDARYVGVDSQGMIYIGDIETRLVQVFNPQGNFVTQWYTGKKDNGKDLFINGMAVDLKGQVYIASSDGIYTFDGQSGERLGIFTYPGEGYFEDVCTAPDGSVLGVYFTYQENIVRFNKNGEVDLYLDNPIGNVTDHSELDTSVMVDGVGNIYLLGSFNNMVFIYNRDGKYQNKFGGDGEGPGTFQAVDAIAVDNQSHIYVSDFDGLQIFDSSGRYLESYDGITGVRVISFDLQGNLYAVTYQQLITKYQINH
jgi:ribosomal protein L7/L12/streptogramin lyase